MRPFLAGTVAFDEAAVARYLARPENVPALVALAQTLESADPFSSATLEPAFRAFAEEQGLKAAALIHATRVAVTGRSVSPGLFDVLELLGRDRVISRLRDARRLLTT
jgi:glutamyl-tRNA synthetase